MTRREDPIDLCINCLNINHCFYNRNKKEPVSFCEEFTCKDSVASLKEIERLEKLKAMFLPIW